MKNASLILFLSFAFQVSAQKNKSFEVDVSVQNQAIYQLFQQIETQVSLKFSYNTKLINADSVITYQAKKPLRKVISEIFGKRVQAKFIGDYIVLVNSKRAEKEEVKAHPELVQFSGLVLNGRDKTPLRNVSIYEISSRKTMLTNAEGFFSMRLAGGNAKSFSVAKVNYQDTLVSFTMNNPSDVTVYLFPISTALEMHTKTVKESVLTENTDFVKNMVPPEGLMTTLNLKNITERRFAQVSFIPTVGTNMKASGVIENKLSLNVLGGYNGGTNGLEIGTFFNILSRNMNGLQIGGLINVVQGTSTGGQFGGVFNKAKGKFIGVQAAGISNFLSDSLRGVQAAGISNVVTGSVKGLQAGGIHNHVSKNLTGMQVAGIINWTSNSLIGLQLAGITNTVASIKGAQLSVIHNLTTKNMNGVQVSLVNYAHTNNGLQFGLINIADSATGVAVGLFNYVHHGYHPIEVFGTEVLPLNFAFKSGVNHFYTTFTAGLNPSKPEIFGAGFGFGAKLDTWKRLSISMDATGTFINENALNSSYNWDLNLLNRLDLTLDFNLGKFSILAGPALNVHVSQLGLQQFGEFTTNIAVNPFYTEVFNTTQVQMWVGVKFGLRYSF